MVNRTVHETRGVRESAIYNNNIITNYKIIIIQNHIIYKIIAPYG